MKRVRFNEICLGDFGGAQIAEGSMINISELIYTEFETFYFYSIQFIYSFK